MTATTSAIPSKPDLVLQAHALRCVRGDRQLFTDLNLRVHSGECLHVRGPNGVGKTSLLRILTGLSKPESGDVSWRHHSIAQDSKQYRQDLLFLGHRDALKEDLTALENIELYAALDNVEMTRAEALAILWRFGLRGREDLPVQYLSAGQKRRVLMARMVSRQAKVWILDEPFNALDVNAVQDLQNLISEHLGTGGLVILTSHQEIQIPQLRVLEL